ncbi:MAG: hypothetical protein JW731_07335 [Bacteroidales bacterium]|nr:hypothetical protein [Bacteroidales bacterium]
MKTAKLMLTLAFLAFGTMLFATSVNPEPESAVIKIKLGEALMNRGLVNAMYVQLDLDAVLRSENQGICRARVKYRSNLYEIHASKAEWVAFFIGGDPKTPPSGTEPPPEY